MVAERVGSAPMKLCRGCVEFKSVAEFSRHKRYKDGRNPRCKDCQNPERAASRAKKREREYLERQGLKRCKACEEVKSLSEFWRKKLGAGGLFARCKDCCRASTDAERVRQRARKQNRENAERNKGRVFDPRETKQCGRCEEVKSVAEFYRCSSRRDGLAGLCKRCYEAWKKERAAANPELRERKKAYEAQWRRENPERAKANHDRWREQNREQIQTYWKNHRELYPDKHRVWNAARNRRYFARKNAAEGEFTGPQWKALCEFYEYTCLCCGARGKVEVDHVVPISKKGSNGVENLQPLCRSCNASKGARTIDYRDPYLHAEFIVALEFL